MKRTVLVLFLASILFSCGNVDDREEIRGRNGDPDRTETTGRDPFWREFWYYDSLGVVYEFRRSAPKCGGGRDVYLYAVYSIGSMERLELDSPLLRKRKRGNPIGP